MKARRDVLTTEQVKTLRGLLSGATTGQLLAISDLVHAAYRDDRNTAEVELSRNFGRGDRVEFQSHRYGASVQGTVKSVNTRSLSLSNCTDGRQWRVAFSLARKVG